MAEDEACPNCGAIYSRVEAYIRAEQARAAPPRPTGLEPLPPSLGADPLLDQMVAPAFVARMRAQSLYPTFRGLVKLGTWLFYLLAIAMLIGGFQIGNSGATLAAFFGAALLAVIATAAKEAALMMADVSDAAVIRAARARNGAD